MKDYLRIIKKWFWLAILGAVLAGGLTYFTARQEPLTYLSTALITVGGQYDLQNPEKGTFDTAAELATYYAITAETNENLQATIDALGLDIPPDYLAGMLDVTTMFEVPILVVSAIDIAPEQAADIANAFAEQIIKNSPTNLSPAEQSQLELNAENIEFLNSQIAALNTRLDEIDAELATLDAETDQDKLVLLQQQRTTIISQLGQFVATVADLNADSTLIRGRTNILKIIEAATPAKAPNERRVTSQAALGAIAGGGFAVALIVIIEYLNTSIRSSEQAVQVLGIPVLGTIARFGKKKAPPREFLITKQTHSLVLEGYRTLQTNLLFTSSGETLNGVYLVTSAKDGEGKSTTAANLAVTMALSGLRVLLIDADLHRPKVHHFFDLDNSVGLATLLTSSGENSGYPDGKAVPESVATAALLRCVQNTPIPNLTVITSGTIDGGATGSLTQVSSGVFLLQRFKDWLDIYRKTREVDIVIFDTPPSLVSVDSSILAATAEADVILVIQTGRTKRSEALRVKGQFVHIGREVRGVVLNKTPRGEVDHGYGYGYYDDLQTLSVRPNNLQLDPTATQQVRPQKVQTPTN